jgi:hypothetical protein
MVAYSWDYRLKTTIGGIFGDFLVTHVTHFSFFSLLKKKGEEEKRDREYN